MRPDEYKKKRSAQYKKKHGIKKDESGKGEKPSVKGQPSSASHSDRAKPRDGKGPPHRSPGLDEPGPDHPSSSDDELTVMSNLLVTKKTTYTQLYPIQ